MNGRSSHYKSSKPNKSFSVGEEHLSFYLNLKDWSATHSSCDIRDMSSQDKTSQKVAESIKEDKKTDVKEEQRVSSSKQVPRKVFQKALKTVSCSELTSQLSKENSCSDLDSNAHLFFNEKGWPVKVMSLTEDSPPKGIHLLHSPLKFKYCRILSYKDIGLHIISIQ